MSKSISCDSISMEEVVFRVNGRAKNYIARVDDSGRILVTLPRRGSRRQALAFVNSHLAWIRSEQLKSRQLFASRRALRPGMDLLFEGRRVAIALEKDWGRPLIRVDRLTRFIADESMDLTSPIRDMLAEHAKRTLPERVGELARRFGLQVGGVTVRSQKTRWGSCSSRRRISLNWKLVQAPIESRDCIIIHELMHLKHMDHSPAFWNAVERACPDYRIHERWLDENQGELSW